MTGSKHILITGVSGFVGSALAVRAAKAGFRVTGTSRQKCFGKNLPFKWVTVSGFEDSQWTELLRDVDVVIHCAARVHQVRDSAKDPLMEFRKVNTEGTRLLARNAVAAGVKRFVFLSTIKVNGEQSRNDRPFIISDTPDPQSAYGISKWEAEQALIQECRDTMEWIVVRPVLVYGPKAKGNLALFERLGRMRLPLPLGHVNNKRSLLSLNHLTGFLMHCSQCDTFNRVALLADESPLTTAEIYSMVCRQSLLKPKVFNLSKPLRPVLHWLLLHMGIHQKLFGSLEINAPETYELFGWHPEQQFGSVPDD